MEKLTQLLTQIAKFVWPIALLLVFFIYREPIKDLVSTRSIKLGTSGVEIGAPAQATQQPATLSAGPSGSLQNRAEPFPVEYKPLAGLIDQMIDNSVPVIMAQFGYDKEKALKHIATVYLGTTYLEKASRNIFGSQVDALILVDSKTGPTDLPAIKDIYSKARAQNSAVFKNYSFEQWMSFLVSQQLVEVRGDSVLKTPGGMALIPYMKSQGYLNFRPPN